MYEINSDINLSRYCRLTNFINMIAAILILVIRARNVSLEVSCIAPIITNYALY